jgi:two-component system response regulator CpxR
MSEVIRLLMVDDDDNLTGLFAEYLEAEGGFELTARHDGEAGVAAALSQNFDVIILDVMMPKMNGFDALKAIRKGSDTPVIMLTARGDDLDRILGLEIGADDYVPKPCNLRELVARIRAILRRVLAGSEPVESGSSRIVVGDLRLDIGAQSVYRNDELISVTGAEYGVLEILAGAEYGVLEILAKSAGEVVSKDAIARHALGRRIMPYDRSVDAHVGHLRKKLGPLQNGLQRIKTVRGRGYLYVVQS